MNTREKSFGVDKNAPYERRSTLPSLFIMPVNIEAVEKVVYKSGDSGDRSDRKDGDSGRLDVNKSAADDMTGKDDVDEKEILQEPLNEADYKCGWGFLTPKCLQKFRKIEFFLATCCCYAFAQGLVVSGLVSVVLSTIEKRFELNSMQSGMIAMGFDLASIVCLIPVSFFGGLSHKPRWIATGSFIMGVGSFLFASPHFMAGSYSYRIVEDQVTLCGAHESVNCSITAADKSRKMSTSNYMYVMFFAHMLHGVGASPVFTLVVTFIDENTPKKHTPTYLAIYYSMALIGPAVGYILGGQMLKLFVEVCIETSLTPGDHQWVGAWWIGFLVSSAILLTISVPLFAFPRELPGKLKVEIEKRLQKIRMMEDFGESESRILKPNDLFDSLKILFFNPVFGFINLCCAAEGALISGFVTFAPKFVESSYNVPASSAAQLIGLCTIGSGGMGIVIGGYVVKRYNMGGLASLKVSLITIALGLVLSLLLLVRCDDIRFAGINIHYGKAPDTSIPREVNLTASCNAECRCRPTDVDPICGPGNINYASACHAGCRDYHLPQKGFKKRYSNCSCIDAYRSGSSAPFPGNFSAVQGKCKDKCNLIVLFMPSYSVIICLTFVICTPVLTATLRCVPANQKSLALGWQMLVARILGMIPAPLIFGAIIDSTCLYWKKDFCSNKAGSCLLYTSQRMGVNLFFVVLFFKTLSFLSISLAYLLMHRVVNLSASKVQSN